MMKRLLIAFGIFAAAAVALCAPAGDAPNAPMITAPVAPGAVRVSGTSTAPAGSSVAVYVNDAPTPAGSAPVQADGSWTISNVGPLVQGDKLTARTTVNGVQSAPSAAVAVSTDIWKTPITQGAFSVLIVKIMKAKVPETVPEQDAISFLEKLGLKPTQGWNISKILNEKTLSDILAIVNAKVGTLKPEDPVSIGKAQVVLQRNAGLFRKYYLTKMTSSNKTETQIVDEGAFTGTPLSPSQNK
jgi:hypothetical protein